MLLISGGAQMQQIHLEGNTNKSDVNYLILDIGGTLCKVCVVEIQNKRISLWLTSLPSSNFLNIREVLDSHFKKKTLNFDKVYLTGGGSYKFSDTIYQLFGNFSVTDEMESTVKGAFFSITSLKSERNLMPKFPIILANIGTGASFILIDENKKFTRIGGTNIAGGTLTGIYSLLKQKNFPLNLSSLIENGNRTNVDILVRDIYGKDYGSVGLDGSIVAGSLGKADKYDGDNFPSDICSSSAFMICSNLVHLLYLYASIHGAVSVLFSGSFVMIPAIANLLRNIASTKFSGCFGIASDLISE